MNETKPKTVFDERDQLRLDYDRVRAAFERQTIERAELHAENARLRAELEAARRESAPRTYRAQVIADVAFETKYEAARKVAEAAVEYDRAKTDYDVDDAYGRLSAGVVEKMLAAHAAMRKAAREYCVLGEPLSEQKRGVIDNALQNFGDNITRAETLLKACGVDVEC